MISHAPRWIFVTSLLGLAACPIPPKPTPPSDVVDVCVGEIKAPWGLTPIEDPELLASAIGEVGAGKLCHGQVYEAIDPVTVYRVWTAAKPYTQLGGWWSFSQPEGPREQYRESNAICPEWSDLDVVSRCSVKVGTHLVLGPGQSAKCKGGVSFAQSAVYQVYIPNDTRVDQVSVEDCTAGEPWP